MGWCVCVRACAFVCAGERGGGASRRGVLQGRIPPPPPPPPHTHESTNAHPQAHLHALEPPLHQLVRGCQAARLLPKLAGAWWRGWVRGRVGACEGGWVGGRAVGRMGGWVRAGGRKECKQAGRPARQAGKRNDGLSSHLLPPTRRLQRAADVAHQHHPPRLVGGCLHLAQKLCRNACGCGCVRWWWGSARPGVVGGRWREGGAGGRQGRRRRASRRSTSPAQPTHKGKASRAPGLYSVPLKMPKNAKPARRRTFVGSHPGGGGGVWEVGGRGGWAGEVRGRHLCVCRGRQGGAAPPMRRGSTHPQSNGRKAR